MKFTRQLSPLLLALCATLPLSFDAAAQQAQRYSTNAAARVDSFGVQPLNALTPGSELLFTLDGTPGANVTLRLEGASDEFRLQEVRPGRYEGSYTVRTRDRLTASTAVTASLQKNGQTARATLDQSLVAGARSPSRATVAATTISRFDVDAPDRLRAGDEMRFSMEGAAGGRARVVIEGVREPVVLNEVRRGVYEGRYTVRRQDDLRGAAPVATAFLTADRRESSMRFARNDEVDRRGREVRSVANCNACGVVEAVNRVDMPSESKNILGTIAGGVAGGVLGNKVGSGSGRDLATIAGAVGGAYAGNRVQNNLQKKQVYRVTVRLPDGNRRDFDYADDPAVTVGAQVRVEEGQLIRL